ncbi:hypothetical protein HK105_206068 [Polyrhizophydium stewartii]|uniref:Uncharacterized protein n=1 Tax=Polyrhizophydium stewartii TaxID=2732419 RepID=A0ABR4N4M1_9FUNG|nr:hypothetical protein HK105_001537 [Polyrhizophydium stewartii]
MLAAAVSALSLFASLASAQLTFQPAPNCGLPADPKCLITNAQYTVVGTVTSNTLNESTSTPANYNATVNIRCVWASFTSPPSTGEGLVGNNLLVANWGFPKAGCPANTGAQAVVGANRILFLYVAASAARGLPPSQNVFAVQDICVGGLDYNEANVKTVASVLNQYPSNAIGAQFRGDSSCALPALSTTTAGGQASPTGSVTVPGNAAETSGRWSSSLAAAAVFVGAFALLL